MSPLHLCLLIHAHQPVGNFESVQEEVYRLSYLPFVEALEKHPGIRVAFHYSGILLEWLEKRRPDYLERLRRLVELGQVEMLGGGFFEPILSAIPDHDRTAQLERMSDWLEQRFGRRPQGAWLTERVWDPSLPRSLAQAGITYTLTDDYHFLSAGLGEDQLHGYYLTEWQGSVVRVLPGLKKLRYMLPFRLEQESIGFLRAVRERHPGGLAAMGDDLEKFGAWPETHQHVHVNGWLRRFFEAVEASSDWLAITLPEQYLAQHEPLGRIYLPTASYQEMMGWALPPGAGRDYQELLDRVEDRFLRFVHGGVWHNFFHKYEEANLLHKRMLDLSRRYQELGQALPAAPESRRRWDQGYRKLLAAQCNDAYWHGVFGGLYSPHLRTAVWGALLEAEDLAGQIDTAPRGARRLDLNVDGRDELLLSTDTLGVVVTPGDGGTVAEISYRPRAYNVINSLARRPEAYHSRLQEAQQGGEGAQSIHDRMVAKEANLGRFLQYDRYHRHAFRTLVFAEGRTPDDYRRGCLEECVPMAQAPFQVVSAEGSRYRLEACSPDGVWQVANDVSIEGSALTANWEARHSGGRLRAGLELVLNFCAPDAHDRYFVLPSAAGGAPRPRLGWSGHVQGESVALVDEWLNLRIDVRVAPAAAWWIYPIYTVSLSEGGFEKVYQGSAILPNWPAPDGVARAKVQLEFGPAR